MCLYQESVKPLPHPLPLLVSSLGVFLLSWILEMVNLGVTVRVVRVPDLFLKDTIPDIFVNDLLRELIINDLCLKLLVIYLLCDLVVKLSPP